MKLFLTALAIYCTSCFVEGQDTTVIYFDEFWQKTEKTNAAYECKVINFSGDKYEVLNYYIDGGLQMKGLFSDEEMKIAQGRFLYYFKNGSVESDKNYVNGELQGKALRYYENGQLANDEQYDEGKNADTNKYYYENGKLASVEVYAMGKLQSCELFNEDGTRDTVNTEPNRSAVFPGGLPALSRFLNENLKYPMSAIENDIQGKCYLRFIIDKEGNVSKVAVLRGVPKCPECDEEAIRVITLMPRWNSGFDHNRAVDSYFNLPVNFYLEPAKKKGRRKG